MRTHLVTADYDDKLSGFYPANEQPGTGTHQYSSGCGSAAVSEYCAGNVVVIVVIVVNRAESLLCVFIGSPEDIHVEDKVRFCFESDSSGVLSVWVEYRCNSAQSDAFMMRVSDELQPGSRHNSTRQIRKGC